MPRESGKTANRILTDDQLADYQPRFDNHRRSLDRHLRMRARQPLAPRPELWLGAGNRGPLTASGIYQVIARRGRQRGVDAWPHRFRHHFSQSSLPNICALSRTGLSRVRGI